MKRKRYWNLTKTITEHYNYRLETKFFDKWKEDVMTQKRILRKIVDFQQEHSTKQHVDWFAKASGDANSMSYKRLQEESVHFFDKNYLKSFFGNWRRKSQSREEREKKKAIAQGMKENCLIAKGFIALRDYLYQKM